MQNLLPKNNEIELKFTINQSTLETLHDSNFWQSVIPQIVHYQQNQITLNTFYYDTKDFELQKLGLVYRIREHKGKAYEATIKTKSVTDENNCQGLSHRQEFNINIKKHFPSLLHFQNTELFKTLMPLSFKPLKLLFNTIFQRTVITIEQKNCSCQWEIALDDGFIQNTHFFIPLRELEIEIKNPKTHDIKKLYQEMQDLSILLQKQKGITIKPSNISKFEQGIKAYLHSSNRSKSIS